MLKRIHIQGYKSLEDVEVSLSQLVVLFGPNAAGKSNLLDALQLLSELGTSRTVKEAFDPPYRGKPLESFTIGQKGIKGLLEQERLSFSIEADLNLSDAVVETVNRQILEMRRPHGEVESKEKSKIPARVRERNLRYRIDPFSTWGPLARRGDIIQALSDEEEELPVSARIMRGNFDA